MEKIKEKIQTLIAYLIYDREWNWLHLTISTLCDLEMQIPLLQDRDFKYDLDIADMVPPSEKESKSFAEENIPKQSLYCQGCPYIGRSNIARTLLGDQACGYCYYLGKGDYSFIRGTAILWDGCKECGRYEFEDDE
jgi:hypothetical protein